MIKVDGVTTQISGELHEILGDTTHLLHVLYKQMVNVLGEEKAKKYFADMGRMAVMSDEELEQMHQESIEKIKDVFDNEV